MEIEKQVCSLGLAEKLKESGIRQDSYLWWAGDIHGRYVLEPDLGHSPNAISAFTVAELGEIIVEKTGGGGYLTEIWKTADWNFRDEKNMRYICADTEADIRAKMILYLAENGWLQ